MKARIKFLLAFSSVSALSGCFEEQGCPAGQMMVRSGSDGSDGVCVPRSYLSKPSGTATASPSASASVAPPSAPTVAAADAGDNTGSSPPATGSGGACGGTVARSESVRVVDKPDATPSLGNASPNLADGSYTLVQASFYRTGTSGSPVQSVRAGLVVNGPTLIVNAQDTTVSGLGDESMTFLVSAQGSVMTKTCESVHGSVSAWFFPFNVGGTTQPQLGYDGTTNVVRVIVSRADGSTELVFAR